MEINDVFRYLFKNIVTILMFAAAFAIFKACSPKDKQVFPVSTNNIEKRIEGANNTVNNQNNYIVDDKKIVSQIDVKLARVMDSLNRYKQLKDSVRIIQIQDTTIRLLFTQGEYKDSIISRQDTIIQAQRYIIDSKDTLITMLKFDLKRVKKQRNWSMIGNGLLTGILIIK